MKKRWISWLLVLTMVAALVPQMAIEARAVQSGTCGDNLTWVLDDEGTLTISGTGAMEDYENYDDSPWYDSKTSIISIIIEDGVTSIGDHAFNDCYYLSNVTIPNSVTTIGLYAFSSCRSLTSMTIPNSVTSIGDRAFSGCKSLTSVTIPNSVTSIGDHVFSECYNLSNVTIPNSVTSIGDHAFFSCWSLTSVTIPSSITAVDNYVFYNCCNLTSVTIPNSVTFIGYDAFNNCNNLTDVYYTGTEEQWYEIDIGSFNECLTNATIHFESEMPSVPIGPTKPEVPAGYEFSEDSYQFDNNSASGKISKKYFTTLYEPAAGKVLYGQHKESGEGGVCFGMTYTTAAIYNGFPTANAFVTRHIFSKDEPCDSIRDLKLKSEFELISNESKSEEISLQDYIRYAHIYQYSSAVMEQKRQTFGNTEDLFEAVRTMLSADQIGVTIGLLKYEQNANQEWEYENGHRVLAVGIDGNDILIDDPNNTETVERLTISNDGSWSFSGYGSYSFSGSWDDGSTVNSVLCYNTDVTMPYYLLYTGNHATPAVADQLVAVMSDEEENVDTYVEGMQRVDSNKMLLCIESDGYKVNNKDMLPIMWSDLGEDVDIFWVNNTSSVVLSDIVGSDTAIYLASDDLLLGVETAGETDISMTNDGTDSSVKLDTAAGTECMLSLETTGTDEQNVILTIRGTASDRSVTMEQTDTGIDITGLNDGVITLTEDDEVVAEKQIPDSDDQIHVEYDPTGNDDDVVLFFTNPFTDVPPGTFYYEPVLWALENGITTGATATTFNPNGKCQRAQVVTFLHRAAGNPVSNSSRNPFTDVKSSDFFYKPVLWAVEEGITNGISATSFGSYDVCNRAAFVTFLWRAAGEPEPKSTNNPFVDVKSTDFFYKPVLWAVEEGVTNGVDATHFGPAGACNRAQVVTFLYRAYN